MCIREPQCLRTSFTVLGIRRKVSKTVLKMDWAKFKLPIPIYQQEKGEKCIPFLRRIQTSLQSSNLMDKEEAVFWFLIGIRDDIIQKIPFDPSVSLWIDPDELEEQLKNIDNDEKLKGPFRTNRFQNCFNYFVCFKCGNWGHKSAMCKNKKPAQVLGRALKRKILELCFEDDSPPPKVKQTKDLPLSSSEPQPPKLNFHDDNFEIKNFHDNNISLPNSVMTASSSRHHLL